MRDMEELRKRVGQFNTMRLPGQPVGWHMGTGYLVSDLAACISELEAELAEALNIERLALAQVKETTAVLDLVSLERNELRAEVTRLKVVQEELEAAIRRHGREDITVEAALAVRAAVAS